MLPQTNQLILCSLRVELQWIITNRRFEDEDKVRAEQSTEESVRYLEERISQRKKRDENISRMRYCDADAV